MGKRSAKQWLAAIGVSIVGLLLILPGCAEEIVYVDEMEILSRIVIGTEREEAIQAQVLMAWLWVRLLAKVKQKVL